MTRAVAAAAVVLAATITVILQDGLEGCCTSAHAQTQTASPEPTPPEPTIWDHNGSVMYLVENGSSREFYYQKPRLGMLDAGAHPGSLLFRGQIDNEQFSGTAYIFNPQCGRIPYPVTGTVLDSDQRIVLTGQAPQVGRDCRAYASSTSTLEFRRLNATAAGPSQEPVVQAAQERSAEQSRSETQAIEVGNSPSMLPEPSPSPPTARPPATNGTPSAAKEMDNYVWAAALIAVVLVVWAAAMLAAA